MWGPDYEELAAQAKRLGWNGAGSFWGLCDFAGIPDRLGYPCLGPNRTEEIQIVSAAIRSRLLERERQQAARFADAHYRLQVSVAIATCIAVVAIIACLLLSGCLTATKIGEWQRAVYGWGMSEGASQACKDAAALAAQYIANANTDLLGTGKLTDLSSDNQAKQLLDSAALACGKTVP